MLQLLRSGKVYFFAQQKRSCDLRFRRLCRNCVFWEQQIPTVSGRLPGNDAKNAVDSEFTSSNATRSTRMILFAMRNIVLRQLRPLLLLATHGLPIRPRPASLHLGRQPRLWTLEGPGVARSQPVLRTAAPHARRGARSAHQARASHNRARG